MIQMSLTRAARGMGTGYDGRDVTFRGCSTDSRTINAGELFIAIKGTRFDGHAFVAAAAQRGACAALVERNISTDLPLLVVADTRKAMGSLARCWRQNFPVPLIAVTGSNGKTTVKEMLIRILEQKGSVLATRGNLNNDIGVPLTLFGMDAEHWCAVLEMGANHPGEIAWLTNIAGPTVAVITQCAPAHLEGFGSIDGVARAKAEIYAGLGRHGVAVVNADDHYAQQWLAATRHLRQITFGLDPGAEVTARGLVTGPTGETDFTLCTPAGEIGISLSLPGRHNVMNALAAAACVTGLELDLEVIRSGLQSMGPVKGRLQRKTGFRQATVLDDTYNANPVSLNAALQVLRPLPGRHWLVLGDMGELGDATETLHAEAGLNARQSGVERLFAIGPLCRAAVRTFGVGAEHFTDINLLVNEVRGELAADVTILVKGSRSMQMERVVTGLEAGKTC